MKKLCQRLSVAFVLLTIINASSAYAFKVSFDKHTLASTALAADAPSLPYKTPAELRSETKNRQKLARKKARMKRFLNSRIGKWLVKRAIKKQERRQKRQAKRYERKKQRWLAKGKDVTKLKKHKRRGNVKTGLLLVIIGALFFFALGKLSPFDIIGIVLASLGLLLILLYLLT
ncbi:cupredoxin domain-containing protein [Microscilla marina]|nr:hypothetical protein [Microscilla marina]